MSTRPEVLELPYLVSHDWFESEVLAGRDPKRHRTFKVRYDDLPKELVERALAVEDSIAIDQNGRPEVHGTGINPHAEDPGAEEDSPMFEEMMDGPIIRKIGWNPELPEPSDDPEVVVAAWESWIEEYRALSLDALRQWVDRWYPDDPDQPGEGNETWWRVTLKYVVSDDDGEREREITFDGRRDLELFQRVRAAQSRVRHAVRLTLMEDAIVADEALGTAFHTGDAFEVKSKPDDREHLVSLYEDFVSHWRRVALAARANRLSRKGAFDREMHAWAKEYGSERLELGLEDGFRMTAVYLEERIAVEFPGFYAWSERNPLDRWRPRVGPTRTALMGRREVQEKLAAQGSDLKADIVWLLDPPEEMRENWWGEDWVDDDDVGPCETIIVLGWLGRYILVGPVSSDEAPIPKGYTWDPVFGSRPADVSGFELPAGSEDDIPF